MRHALVLGGTKGLGLSLACQSHLHGLIPIVTGRSLSGEDTRKELGPENVCSTILFRKLDLTDLGDIDWLKLKDFNIPYFFWVAGVFSRKSLRDLPIEDLNQMIDVHLRGPIRVLQQFHKNRVGPYHLVVVASTSSWRMRTDETIYCALKAAKAAFARNFARELVRDFPGSKVTLVNPGGLKTPNFWGVSGQDISKFMEPKEVAKIIWDEVLRQEAPYHEIQMMRNDDGSPKVEYGPRLPELPF